jgi:tetratricopeptide (TPR) repeat protein
MVGHDARAGRMKKTATQSEKGTARSRQVRPSPGQTGTSVSTAPVMNQEKQGGLFEEAIRLFHREDYAQAKELFEKAATGPAREMAHAARVHARMCEQRIDRSAPALDTADDHYNYAVALINRNELQAAEKHLREGVRLTPQGDHIHYALALARGLRGDIQQARESLKRAIDLDPRNRIHARNDPDFAELAQHPAILALLFPENR